MLVQVLDAEAQPHIVVWQGQDQINDGSAALGAGAIGANQVPQQVAAANLNRAGFLFQNTAQAPMLFLEIAGTQNASAWIVGPGQYFPPISGYPIPIGVVSVLGTAQSQVGDTFAFREWINAPNE